jgi:hypothetical protein
MKVLSIGNFGHGWDGSICDEEHIASALEELGHEVYRVQREELPHALMDTTVPDFTLIAQWDGYEDLSVLPHPLVYWAFDYQAEGQEWHERLVREADLYLSKRIADSKYPNWQWLAQDFAPKFLDKYPDYHNKLGSEIDVLFTGSYLPWATERNETLKAVDEKFNLVIHSVNEWPGFKDVRPPMMDDSLPYLYAQAKVILSIDHTIEAGYWSDRNAQIMACGRRPLFRYVPLSESTFHNYVDYFYNVEDCLRKIEHNLVSEDGGAYKYAQENLKVTNRVQDLLTIVRGIL